MRIFYCLTSALAIRTELYSAQGSGLSAWPALPRLELVVAIFREGGKQTARLLAPFSTTTAAAAATIGS